MAFNPVLVAVHVEKPPWYQSLDRYAQPNPRIAAWQLSSTLTLYFAALALMIFTVKGGYPYGLTLALAVAAAAVFVRIFIFFHDCTHGSFVHSPRWNRNIGYLCGILTFTAFHDWRRSHAGHHITAGDLDRRGFGDITTLTVEEYLAASPRRRLGYRIYRSPAVMFTVGPAYYLLPGEMLQGSPGAAGHPPDNHAQQSRYHRAEPVRRGAGKDGQFPVA